MSHIRTMRSKVLGDDDGADLSTKIRTYLIREGKIDKKGKYIEQNYRITDANIVEWLCFPEDRPIGYFVNGSLVTSASEIRRIEDSDDVKEARAPIRHTISLKRKPPRWRDLNGVHDGEQVYPLLHAIIAAGHCVPFTINVGHERAKIALADNNTFLDYMHRRIRWHLRNALGREVDFFAVVGFKSLGGDRPHLHGSILIAENEIDVALEALRKAADNRDKRAVDLQSLKAHQNDAYADSGRGWAKYCLRNVREAQGKVDGKLVSRTNKLGADARRLYMERRASFLKRSADWSEIKAVPLTI